MLRVIDQIIDITTEMRVAVEAIARKDADMARQIRRSWSSAALNSAEGQRQRGAKSLNRFDDAMGSAREAWVSLRVSVAWGYLEHEPTAPLLSFPRFRGHPLMRENAQGGPRGQTQTKEVHS